MLAGLRRPAIGLAHRLWRLIPSSLRRRALFMATAAAAPRPAANPEAAGVLAVAGLLSTTTGLGENARLLVGAIRAQQWPVVPIDLSARFDQSDLPVDAPVGLPPAALPAGPGTLLLHINANYLPLALLHLPRRTLARKKIIGYWNWELPRAPASWRRGYPFVHEVWVPSRFTAEALSGALQAPIHIVPPALPPPPPMLRDWRARLGVPADAVLAGCFFHMGSSYERKNPMAAIRAFKLAAAAHPAAWLVVKMNDGGVAPALRQALFQAIAEYPRIVVLEDKLSDAAMTDLVRALDILISLHRAEGYGLHLARAMQLGRVVVATGWSGNVDFMDESNAVPVEYRLVPARDPQETYEFPDQLWADPSVEHAAGRLAALFGDRALRDALGARAAADIAARLAPENWPGRALLRASRP